MAESIHDQIISAIVDSLTGIASGLAGSPGAVVAVDAFDKSLLDSSFAGPIYAVCAGEEEHREGQTGDTSGIARIDAEMDVFVLCLQAFPDDGNPFKQREPPRRRVVDRMVKDVLAQLLVDVRLTSVGGAVNNIFGNPVIVSRDRFVSNWAVAEIQFRPSYTYGSGTP